MSKSYQSRFRPEEKRIHSVKDMKSSKKPSSRQLLNELEEEQEELLREIDREEETSTKITAAFDAEWR